MEYTLPIRLSEREKAELLRMSQEYRYKIQTIIRLGWGMGRILAEEQKHGHRIIVTDNVGNALRELVLPEPDQLGTMDEDNLFEPVTSDPTELQQAIDFLIRGLDPDLKR